jgi:hypothetical protein
LSFGGGLSSSTGSATAGFGGTSASIGFGGVPGGDLLSDIGSTISGLFGGPAGPGGPGFGGPTGLGATAPGVGTPAVQLTKLQQRCVEVLQNPSAYDDALVELCKQVRAKQRQAQRSRRQARN